MLGDFFVLTTNGPVRIQRIAEEAIGLKSVVCINGTAKTLPISPAYDAFVRAPTGVVERLTGHSSYRVDVAGEIDTGSSWQLGLYLAHVMHHLGLEFDRLVYATGEVDNALNIRSVTHIDRKLSALHEHLPSDAETDKPPIILIPKANADDVPEIPGVLIVAVAKIDEALDALRLDRLVTPSAAATSSSAPQAQKKSVAPWRMVFATMALCAFAAMAGIYVWSAPMRDAAETGQVLQLEKELQRAKSHHLGQQMAAYTYEFWRRFVLPNLASLNAELEIERSASARECVPAARATVDLIDGAITTTGPLCALSWRTIFPESDGVVSGRLGYFDSTQGMGERPQRTLSGNTIPTGRLWQIDFAAPPAPGARLRLVVVVGPVAVRGEQPWNADLLAADMDSLRFKAAKDRLSKLGYGVVVHEWMQN